MAKLDLYIDNLLKKEGGYVVDSGGPTNKGITLDAWRLYGRDLNNDHIINEADIKLISNAEAFNFYKKNYWDKVAGDRIQNQQLAEIVFDHAVNAGVSRAIKMLQYILNNYYTAGLVIDGVMGEKTLSEANRANGYNLAELFKTLRTYYYNYLANTNIPKIPSGVQDFLITLKISPNNKYQEYIKGWLTRVNSFIITKKKA